MPPTVEFALDQRFGFAEEPFVFPCTDFWSHETPLLDFMAEQYGDCQLDSLGGSFGWPVRYKQVEDYEAINLSTLGEYIAAFRDGAMPLPYLRHLSVNKALQKLRAHIRHPTAFGPNWVNTPALDRYSGPEIFLGQAGTAFGNFHQDHASVHIGFVQLEGSKEFTLFRPEEGRYLYRMEGRQFPWQMRNSAIKLDSLDDYERYPDLRYTSPRKITVNAGQALFLPADWWHTTRNLTDSVSYSIRIVNASNVGRTLMRHLEGLPKLLSRKLLA